MPNFSKLSFSYVTFIFAPCGHYLTFGAVTIQFPHREAEVVFHLIGILAYGHAVTVETYIIQLHTGGERFRITSSISKASIKLIRT